MVELNVAIAMYEYFYSKMFQSGMGIVRSEKNIKTILGFIEIAKSNGVTVGAGWLFNYCVFQFNRIHNQPNINGKVYLNNVYGKKAFERWQKKNQGWRWYASKEFLKSRGIKRDIAVEMIRSQFIKTDQKDLDALSPSEEMYKRVHGCNYIVCLQFTSLYHPKSSHCKGCKSKMRCKKTLEKRDYQLLSRRINEANFKFISAGAFKGRIK